MIAKVRVRSPLKQKRKHTLIVSGSTVGQNLEKIRKVSRSLSKLYYQSVLY